MTQITLEQRFNALLTAHGAALMRLVRSYVRSSMECEDLYQEIAIAIWRALPRFRGECSERTFVFRIAHNRCLTQVSRRRLAVIDDDQPVLVAADPRPTVETQLVNDQQRERLFDAVRTLSPGYRHVVTLILEGLSYREVADVLGISESNVGVRLNRARQLLKDEMEQ